MMLESSSSHQVLGLHGLQLGVVLAHLLHVLLLQAQHFVQVDELLGELGLTQRVAGREGRVLISGGGGIALLDTASVTH